MIEENKKASTLIQRGLFAIRCSATPAIKIAAIFVRCFVLLWERHYIKVGQLIALFAYTLLHAMHKVPYPKTIFVFRKRKEAISVR